MKTKVVFAVILTVFTITAVIIAINSFKLKPEPNRKITYEKIIKKHDSIGVAVVNVSAPDDTAGLHKLEAFKKRLAAATLRRQLDSLKSLQNNRQASRRRGH